MSATGLLSEIILSYGINEYDGLTFPGKLFTVLFQSVIRGEGDANLAAGSDSWVSASVRNSWKLCSSAGKMRVEYNSRDSSITFQSMKEL
jgi:hypothetical protein